MYSDHKNPGRLRWWLLLLLTAAVAAAFLISHLQPKQDIRENSIAAIRTAVERSAKQCYAVEGVYPPDLKYLEENYGLQINERDYYITYEVYASNQPPTVRVSEKQK